MAAHCYETTTEFLYWLVQIRAHYDYSPGAPEQGPTYACGGVPADPPEVSFVKIECRIAKTDKATKKTTYEDLPMSPEAIRLIEEWLFDYHFEELCDNAEQ